jgi:transposase
MRVGPVVDLESLPEDRAALRDIVAPLSGWNERLLAEVFRLRRRAYGPKSERLPDGQTIFDGYGRGVEEAPLPEPEKQAPPPEGAKKRKGHGRRVVDPDLPRPGILHDLSEDEKNCGRCGKRMRAFDDEVSEQLEVEPAWLFVLAHVRPKYGCPDEDGKGTIRIAPPATGPIERGLAGPGLIAHTIVEKYDDPLPLYRQSERWALQGIEMARSTRCEGLKAAVPLLRPIVQALLEDVLASRVVHTDDTPVKVLVPGLDYAPQAYLCEVPPVFWTGR